jgi:hypothetical protein
MMRTMREMQSTQHLQIHCCVLCDPQQILYTMLYDTHGDGNVAMELVLRIVVQMNIIVETEQLIRDCLQMV